jgi:hypothetical protein
MTTADVELIQLGRDFAAARARSDAMHGVPDEVMDAATGEETRIVKALMAHRATTLEGLRIKATAAAWHGMPESILRDLTT